ncbi:LPS translocon maturation chaperone LptM [Cellvibrio polysaccharolyticus]|uniref:Lipopeptide n=1 Tax=Cellvibrio polysaccharolyticus TaxID=2082724 RepID=A0A928YUG6_9GAMM|nr:lipoprotein [Cellvibrio polysaccharolyticus]MBE8716068.1 lipopeptide precursor [Cellvibrio polysaccharolyticus]
MKYLVAMLLIFSMCLTACGQKGPLYLPQPEQPTEESSTVTP